jgi:hypothetical protein
MNEQVLGLAIEFSIRTVFLAGVLWGLVKIQELDGKFLGLLGSAALSSGLDMIPTFGHYIAVVALWLCLMKATNGDLFPDIALTVAVGYALEFCLNLFVLGVLLGDLRPSHRDADQAKADPAKAAPAKADPAKAATHASSEDKPGTKEPPTVVAAPSKVSEPAPQPSSQPGTKSDPVPPAPGPQSPAQPPSNQPVIKSALEVVRNFSVRGIIEGADQPTVAIYSGLKTYTLVTGETCSFQTKDGRIMVRFDGMRAHQVLLTVSGEPVVLSCD